MPIFFMDYMPYQARVLVSQVIPGPINDVWDTVRSFDSIDSWHPGITDCTIDEDRSPVQIGAVRDFQAGDRTVRERLLAHSDVDQYYQYTMEDGGAKTDYLSEFRLIPITESNQTLAKWFAHYDVEEEKRKEEAEHLNHVFSAGLNNLRDVYSK